MTQDDTISVFNQDSQASCHDTVNKFLWTSLDLELQIWNSCQHASTVVLNKLAMCKFLYNGADPCGLEIYHSCQPEWKLKSSGSYGPG